MEQDFTNPQNFKPVARPSWDEYFMMCAKLAATRATCLQRKVGSVVVKNKRIVSSGFNGSPPGLPHCTEVGCLIFPDRGTSCQRVLHSEHNAILQDSGKLEGATLYTSYLPCLNCMKIIISAKIREVVYEIEKTEKGEYENAKKEFAQQAGIILRKIPEVKIVNILKEHYEAPESVQLNMLPSTKLQIEKLHSEAKIPAFSYAGDAGADLYSVEELVIEPGAKVAVKTGLKFAIPKGFAGFVWDKSGLAVKNHIKTMAGVIDSNYRGELMVVLTNLGKEPYRVEKGSKVAQLIIEKVETPEIEETIILDETERGAKGFGSSGTN